MLIKSRDFKLVGGDSVMENQWICHRQELGRVLVKRHRPSNVDWRQEVLPSTLSPLLLFSLLFPRRVFLVNTTDVFSSLLLDAWATPPRTLPALYGRCRCHPQMVIHIMHESSFTSGSEDEEPAFTYAIVGKHSLWMRRLYVAPPPPPLIPDPSHLPPPCLTPPPLHQKGALRLCGSSTDSLTSLHLNNWWSLRGGRASIWLHLFVRSVSMSPFFNPLRLYK